MATDERAAEYKVDVHDISSLLSYISVSGYGMQSQFLKAGREAIEKEEFVKAHELLVKALQRTYGSRQLNGSGQSARGLVAMYLAICHHAQGDFSDALLHYLEAKEAFSDGFDGYNTNIALYACGLAYAWSGQEAKVGDIVQELDGGYRGQTLLDKLTKRNKEIDQMRASTSPPDVSDPTADAESEKVTVPAGTSDAVSKKAESELTVTWAVRLASLFLLVILAALVIVSLIGLSVDRLVMVLTLVFFSLALYLVFDKLLDVPVYPGCYTVLQRGSGLIPVFKHASFARRPFDKVVAFVPTYSHYTQPPKQKVATGPGAHVEIQVSVSYGIDGAAGEATMREQIKKAVGVAQEVISLRPRNQDKITQKPLTPVDLTRAWEKRLKAEVDMTLREVLPQHEFKNLFCDKGTKKSTVCEELQASLNKRTERWGIHVNEVRIIEVNQVKA